MELYGWIRVSTDAYEEDFDKQDEALRKIADEIERVVPLHKNVFLKNGIVLMSKVLNRSHQADPFKEFFRFVEKVAPASYGLLYFRDDEGLEVETRTSFTFSAWSGVRLRS
ncbi:MAG TPA: Imm7 family immunity protein [Abditibacteriaceae bacterium]|jgi:hypothetical protein